MRYTEFAGRRVSEPLLKNLLMSIKAFNDSDITSRLLGVYDEVLNCGRIKKHHVVIDFLNGSVSYRTTDPDGNIELLDSFEYVKSELEETDVLLRILKFTEENLRGGM